MGNCSGTCKLDFDITDYKIRLELAAQALEGNHKAFLKTIKQQMLVYIKNLEFEKARTLNNYVQDLDKIFETLKTRFTEKKYAHDITQILASMRRKSNELYMHWMT